MVGKLRELWPVKRVVSLAAGFWNTFLRDNKVIPPVLAVAALFVFAWIVFGSFIGAPEDEPVSSQDEIAQSDGDEPPAPEVENPNTDSYAAYQSKDPFRQLFQTPESTSQQEDTTDSTDATDDGSEDTSEDPDGGGGGGGSGGSQDTDDTDDTDGDGISTGNPGATDEQYDNDDESQSPRRDPTDDAGNDSDTDSGGDAGTQTPAQPNRPAADPADPGDGLFDSGGDLREPNRR